MAQDKPLFPLMGVDEATYPRTGWSWKWIRAKHRDRNIQPGDIIVEMELSPEVSGGNWMIYIGRKEHVATAHLFRWDDQDRSQSWEKVAERDFRVRLPTKNYKMVSYMKEVISKAAVWAEETMYPADRYLYLKTKQNPASDWTLISTRPSIVGKTYSYRNKFKPKYVLALKVRRAGSIHPTRKAPKTYTTTVVLYSGTRGGPEDATELLVRVGELDEVWTTKVTGKPGVLSSFKYPAMAWADDIIFSPGEYLYLKQKRNPSQGSPQKRASAVQGMIEGMIARYRSITSLGAAQKFYVELGERLGRPEYHKYGGHLPRKMRGMSKLPESKIITREQALEKSKTPGIAKREMHLNRSWREAAKKQRRQLEKEWGAVVRVTRADLPKKKKKKKVQVTLSPEEQTAAMIKRLTASQAKDDR